MDNPAYLGHDHELVPRERSSRSLQQQPNYDQIDHHSYVNAGITSHRPEPVLYDCVPRSDDRQLTGDYCLVGPHENSLSISQSQVASSVRNSSFS